ncbi:MAG TPA: histidine kinase [Puia sp.]
MLLSVLFPAVGGSLMAQNFEQSNFIRYTRLDGLSNNYVSGVAEDSTGYIWVATHKGLSRFDGRSFLSIYKDSTFAPSPIPDNYITSMMGESPNEIIGTTRAGAFSFDPVHGRYKQFIIPCDSSIFFWTNHTMDIAKDRRGNYSVSTKTGLYIFDSTGKLASRFDYYRSSDVGKVELLFGGWVRVLSDGTTFQQNIRVGEGSLYDPRSKRIDTNYVTARSYLRRMMTDTSGQRKESWPGWNGELFIANADKNSIDVADLHLPQGRSNPMPFSIGMELSWYSRLDRINDSLYTLTGRSNGFFVLHYNARTKELTCDGKKYFTGVFVTEVFTDSKGRLWIATADGLYKENQRNSFFSVNDLSGQMPSLLNNAIRTIYMDNQTIFLGLRNEGGVLLVDKRTGKILRQVQFAPQKAYSNTIINLFPYDKDTLWVGTSRGIVWFCKSNFHYGHLEVPPALAWTQKINTLVFFGDSRGDIWISFGDLNSVIRYQRSTRRFFDLSAPANPLLKITFVFSIAEDLQGNIWLAGDGLCRWNLKKQDIDTLIPFPKVSRLLRNYMFILDRDDKNNLWLSSYDNEIIQFNCTTKSMVLQQAEDNLIDGNTITCSPIINNNIWMGTDNGISAFNIHDHTVKQFTYADGLPSVSITSSRKESFYDASGNRCYLAARYQLISFVPDVSLSHKETPKLFFEKISVRGSTVVPQGEDLRLDWPENTVAISFNTVNFTDPEENRFAWRMIHGADSLWNDLNNQTGITLANLTGGLHPIQIKLYSANNHWPEQVKSLNIYIRPPFWKTIWFSLLLAAFVTGIILFVYRARINTVRKKEREKALVQQVIAEEYKNRLELEQIINYFSSSLTDKVHIEDVLSDITHNLISRLGYADCIIYLWNPDRTKMLQKAAYGPKGTEAAVALRPFEVAPGEGLVGYVMQTGEAVLVPDARKDRRYRAEDLPRLSEICVPIIHNDELLGIIDSEHPQANYFKERDIKILTTIATLVGNKIKQIEADHSLEIQQKEIAFINQQLAEAQLSALQTQMNPHFIFNCLNSIKGMILSDEREKASRYLSKFATMIRITLNQSKEIFTTLYENIEHLENYLVMEKLRFDDSFCFRIIVEDDIDKEETLIPTLMIQPLAENAIWHGLMYKSGEKDLTIRFFRYQETISCSIEDNGIGINRSEQLRKLSRSTHRPVGLSNLRNRIKIMNEKYDTGCTLEIKDLQELGKDEEGSGTRAVLRFKIITNKLYI